MNRIDTSKWEEFEIGKFFNAYLSKDDIQPKNIMEGNVPLVSSGKENNGIVAYIDNKKAKVWRGNTLTVDMFGKVFYQELPYHCVSHGRVNILIPKFELSEYVMKYFSVVIETVSMKKYAFQEMCTGTKLLKDIIKLPVDENHQPDFSYMESYMKNREIAVSASLTKLQSAKRCSKSKNAEFESWKTYKIKDIFRNIVKPTVYHTREVKEASTGIPYVVRSKFNNGIKYNVERPVENVNPAKVISFGAENATFFYQKSEWISGRDMYYIDTGDISEYACLFITSCLQPIAEKYSYNYGMFPDLLKEEKIKLPADKSGNPDYQYMEDYIKKIAQKSKQTLDNLKSVIV